MKHLIILFACVFGFFSCQAELSLETKGADRGKAKIQDFNTEKNLRVALIEIRKITDDKKPELNYGSMDAHFVTLDSVSYMVHWNDTDDFKNIKRGETTNFRTAGYIAHVEKTGQNYKVIYLNEL